MAVVPKLTNMLQLSPQFTDPTVDDYVAPDKQHIFIALAESFQTKTSHLYEDPDELTVSLQVGNTELWEEFLNTEPVRLYVTARTKNLTAVHARKSILNLQKSAGRGEVNAIKYLNEISGILQRQTDNKQIVLTYVPRPEMPKFSTLPEPNIGDDEDE